MSNEDTETQEVNPLVKVIEAVPHVTIKTHQCSPTRVHICFRLEDRKNFDVFKWVGEFFRLVTESAQKGGWHAHTCQQFMNSNNELGYVWNLIVQSPDKMDRAINDTIKAVESCKFSGIKRVDVESVPLGPIDRNVPRGNSMKGASLGVKA